MRRFCLKFQTHHEIRDDRKGKRKAGRLAFGDFRPENREIFTKKKHKQRKQVFRQAAIFGVRTKESPRQSPDPLPATENDSFARLPLTLIAFA